MLGKTPLFNKRDDVPVQRDPRAAAANSVTSHPAVAAAPIPAQATAGSPPAAEPAVAARPASPQAASRLVVGPDVKLKGAEILDCDTLIVEGRVEATMDSRVIEIAERGAFSGKVGIDIAEIHGSFDGELLARERLVIHASGRVSGKIRYGRILIEEGGVVSGDVRAMADEAAERARAPLVGTVADVAKPKVLAGLG